MEQPTEATADQPSGPAGSEDAVISSFQRLLAVEDASDDDAPATPTPQNEPETPAEDEDAEPAPSDEAPDDTEATDDSEEPASEPTYTVKVDGKVLELPVSELTKGYQRYADYTRKTTELANERKALEAEIKNAARVREEYANRLEPLAKALKELAPEPDWERLKTEDPIGFATQFAEYQIRQQQLQAIEQEQQRVRSESESQRQQEMQQFLAEQQRLLLESVPEWKDSAKAKAEHDSIMTYAKSRGFRDDELAQVTDHRLVLLLRDAARYRQLAEKVKGTPVPTSKAVKPSPTVTPKGTRPPVSDLTKERQRLAKTGKEQDAVPIFLRHVMADTKRK